MFSRALYLSSAQLVLLPTLYFPPALWCTGVTGKKHGEVWLYRCSPPMTTF